METQNLLNEIARLNQEIERINIDCSIACAESYALGWADGRDPQSRQLRVASNSEVTGGWKAEMPKIEMLAKDILKLHRPDAEGAD